MTDAKRIRIFGITVLGLALPHISWGQWNCSGGACTTSGNVGIGTTSPGDKLNVVGASSLGFYMAEPSRAWIGTRDTSMLQLATGSGTPGWGGYGGIAIAYGTGNVGIGTTAPHYALEVNGEIISDLAYGLANLRMVTGNYGILWRNDGQNTYVLHTASGDPYGGWNSDRQLVLPDNGDNVYLSLNGGHVGIGTWNPQYPLSVNGTIQAKEVIVNTGWADYVFNPQYQLKPLSEVASYIKENHHLPDIPSEVDVRDKGVGIGEMQVKLLAKVEELTLHLIEAERQNRQLQAHDLETQQKDRELQDRIARLEARLEELATGGVKK